MIDQRPAPAPLHLARRLVVALTAVVLLVAACSTSGDKKLTSADLSDAMPTAQDIGDGFQRDRAGENDDDNETQLDVPQECRALINEEEDTEKERAKREFKDGEDRELEVSATVTEKTVASIEESAQGCKEVPFTNGQARGVIKITTAESDDFGDDALTMDLELVFSEPITATVKGHGILAKRGDIGMSVVGLDGIDSDANVTPIDNEVVDKAARQLDQRIEAALG